MEQGWSAEVKGWAAARRAALADARALGCEPRRTYDGLRKAYDESLVAATTLLAYHSRPNSSRDWAGFVSALRGLVSNADLEDLDRVRQRLLAVDPLAVVAMPRFIDAGGFVAAASAEVRSGDVAAAAALAERLVVLVEQTAG